MGADRYLQQSIVWVARPPDGAPFDEDSPVHPSETTRSAVDAERIASRASEEHGLGVGVLRCGWFYSADSAHVREFGERLTNRRVPIVGGGPLGRRDARLSFLHVDDAAGAFTAAAEGDVTGTWHVVDEERATFAAFLRALTVRLDAPSPFRVPGWLARVAVPGDQVRLLTTPMVTSNERFSDAFDWAPTYPTYRDGLDEVVERWREEGFLL